MVNKESLLKFFLGGYIHLSKKDYGFFNNLSYIIDENNKITTNQAKLFDKLIVKYQRQLKKENKDINDLLSLVWQTPVVESKQEYLDAHLRLENKTLIIKSPFNTRFVQEFRRKNLQTFTWDKEQRLYRSPFSTHALRIALTTLNKHFSVVNFCPEVQKLLDDLVQYKDVQYWNPTYKKVNGNYIIVATNNQLNEITSHINFNNHPTTLFELTKYGIDIDADLIENELLRFSGSKQYRVDIDDFETICQWLKLLNVDTVITSRDIIYNKQIHNDIKSKLNNYGISIKSNVDGEDSHYVVLRTLSTNVIRLNPVVKMSKIIVLTNSRKIEVM